jgi:hypothetical protein
MFGRRFAAMKPVIFQAASEEQAGPKEPDGEVLRGDSQVLANDFPAQALEFAFQEHVGQVSGELRQTSPEHLPEFVTFALDEGVATPVAQWSTPVAATIEHPIGPVIIRPSFPKSLFPASLPKTIRDLVFEDCGEPTANRRPPGERITDPERREESLLHQVGGNLRVPDPDDGEPEKAVPVIVDPGVGI